MIRKSSKRELLDYSGIFAILIVSIFAIAGMIQFSQFNLLFHVFSDLGVQPESALLFHTGIVLKALVDVVYIRHLIAEIKLNHPLDQILFFVPVIAFVFIAVFTKAPATNLLHWTAVFITFAGWLYIQYRTSRVLKNKLFRENTDFIIFFELVFTVVTMSNRLFWCTGEIIMFALFVYWMWLTQKELVKL